MKKWIKNSIDKLLSKMNLRIINRRYWLTIISELENYKMSEEIEAKRKITAILKSQNKVSLEKYEQLSSAQILQDIFVLDYFDYKRDGYFVEFGATNGRNLSNTYILEKYFGWNGIVAEPAKKWQNDLRQNRSCIIETDCVWSSTGETLQFVEAKSAELSTISNFKDLDIHSKVRIEKKKYNVLSLSLIDMLGRHNAPKRIDYLSIDTEGSEFEILKNFVFSKYSIGVITCEHNFGVNREKIKELLEFNGFIRVHEKISQFDDWYVNSQW